MVAPFNVHCSDPHMYKVFDCIAHEHDLRLSSWRPSYARWARTRRSACFSMSASRAPACGGFGLPSPRRPPASHLGDAFHRDAGVFARRRHRLQHRPDRIFAGRRDRPDRARLGRCDRAATPALPPGLAAPWWAAASRRCTTPAWRRSKSPAELFGIRCWWRCRLRSAASSGPPRCSSGCIRIRSSRDSSARCCSPRRSAASTSPAMGAASISPDPTIQVSASALPAAFLAVAVALASFVVVALALGGVTIEMRERRRAGIGSWPDARPRQCLRRRSPGLRRRLHRHSQ